MSLLALGAQRLTQSQEKDMPSDDPGRPAGPKMNPMKKLYWKQFGGGPTEAVMKRMDPTSTTIPK